MRWENVDDGAYVLIRLHRGDADDQDHGTMRRLTYSSPLGSMTNPDLLSVYRFSSTSS